MANSETTTKVENLLKPLTLDNLKKLFWEELNYNRSAKTLSMADFREAIKGSLAEPPQLFATAGDGEEFHIIYLRFKKEKLLLTEERAIVNKMIKQHPYSLFIFSNAAQNLWHFTNVRLPDKDKDPDDPIKRKLIRRIVIGQDENLKTAISRISLLEINTEMDEKQAALEIQHQHDEAFDVEKVTKQFYDQYKALFKILWKDLLNQIGDSRWSHDYALQILNRLMFLYFIQRKRWIGNDPDWLTTFWTAYQKADLPENRFVSDWLGDLFFCAFNNKKIFQPDRKYPPNLKQALMKAPYLNGGIFEENDLDLLYKNKFTISDRRFKQILTFLNTYNFTVREDSPLDQEVAVDAEMLGKVYESLVNVSTEIDERGEAGIFYTPRIEIDLMSRLALVDNLANNINEEHKNAFYEFVFAMDSEEKEASDKQLFELGLCQPVLHHLRKIKVVDPACGSGAFLVGMLLVIDDLIARAERCLLDSNKHKEQYSAYDRRKSIILNSLYGVDVMQWAVEIAELRLWLQLVIETDIPLAELGNKPLLPKLSFKIRRGDSLVQPVPSIYDAVRKQIRRFSQKFTSLRNDLEERKSQFFNNEVTIDFAGKIEKEELDLYREGYQEIVQDCKKRIFDIKRSLEEKTLNAFGETEFALDEATRKKKQKELAEYQAKLIEYERYLDYVMINENFFGWDKDFSEVFRMDQDGFDIVIGNPPYVRQEKIAPPSVDSKIQNPLEKKKYKQELALAVYSRYPTYFKDNKIQANSDLYIYFYYIGLSLLNTRGSFCFITSNSWLDVGYGAGFQRFLLKTTRIKFIIDNNVKRSFADANINTIITLFDSPDETRKESWSWKQRAVFVSFQVPFEEIESAIVFEELEECLGRRHITEYKVNVVNYKDIYMAGTLSGLSDNISSIFSIKYTGDKWGGKYLRASDIFWKLLDNINANLVGLNDIASVRFGLKTGADDFFYLTSEKIEIWNIESEFLLPVIKSAKESCFISINKSTLKTFLFNCDKKRKDLENTNALKYIEWGESNGVHKVPSVKGRKIWYNVGLINPADGIILRRIGERYIVFEGNGVIENNVLFGITRNNDDIDKDLLLAVLNSTVTRLFIETLSSQLTGAQTVSDTNVYVIRKIPILNPLLLDKEQKENLKYWFEKMKTRPIVAFKHEIKHEDRIKLDKLILESLGLVLDSDLNELYTAMNEIINNRLRKSKSLKRKNN